MMEYKFTFKPIIISAPTEEDAWDELFHQYDIDPDNVEISVECISDPWDYMDDIEQSEAREYLESLGEVGE